MKLQKIVNRLQKLHPKEIDLSLGRIKTLCKKLGEPQDKIKAINFVGTNGKNSTIQACYSILKEAGIKCNVYTSPHVQKINERFVFNNQQLKDKDLASLFEEVEKVNNNEPITFFEILTACFFYKASQYPNNINLIEAGLFHRFDATNILRNNLASVVCSISKDHLDWLPEDQRTIEKIVFEKTSSLLNSNIIVSKQNSQKTTECIKKTIDKNLSKKLIFNEDFSYSIGKNEFFYYEDKFGVIKLTSTNIPGQFQMENISTAIATLKHLNIVMRDDYIKNGVTKIKNIGRLQEINSGRLKKLVGNNRLLIDGSHNEDGSRALNEYLQTLNCNKHVIIGMMSNKDHKKYISYFKNISSFTTVDIPNQINAISGQKLKEKFKNFLNIQHKESIEQAIKSIALKENDLLIITGSLYLAGEALNLN